MKIVEKDSKYDAFGSIPPGTVFRYSNTILMKVESEFLTGDGDFYNCVSLENGEFAYCEDYVGIVVLEAELTVR